MLPRSILLTVLLTGTPLYAAGPPVQQPIPRATFISNMNAEFASVDGNKDGKLTKQDIEAFQRASAAQVARARNRAMFEKIDSNHDGQLSPEEFAQLTPYVPKPDADPMLKRFDSNQDGVISQIEFRAATLANFDRLDTDKDGVVSSAEMRVGGIGNK